MSNGAERIRMEVMIRFVRRFFDGTLETCIDSIPIRMRPKSTSSSRCCIYHDRAVLRYRLMTLLGFSCEEEIDETKPLVSYLADAKQRTRPDKPLSVCGAACAGCPDSSFLVTRACRGCFARPCQYACPKNAITVEEGKSRIDEALCIKCGKCAQVCPYHAITRTAVPCEEACPVGAIRKNGAGVAEIDYDQCIFCGKCYSKCPFAAIMERSEMFAILSAMKAGRKLVALVAPSAQIQFPGTLEQLFSAIAKAGFDDVVEVASGAERTMDHEAHEFVERMQAGAKLMTTSCCPAWTQLVSRHFPAFSENVSRTPSPMLYAAQIAKTRYPDAVVVFMGPCLAKRSEARLSKDIDHVMTFQELGALLAGRNIDIITQEPWRFTNAASAPARNFARNCGVTEAVLHEMAEKNLGANFTLNAGFVNGIDRKTLPLLRVYAAGKTPHNFLEVMGCEGGCACGPCSLVKE